MIKMKVFFLVTSILMTFCAALPAEPVTQATDAYSTSLENISLDSEVNKEKGNEEKMKDDTEETDKQKLNHANCGPVAILQPIKNLIIHPTPDQTVELFSLPIYRDRYGGYGSGYISGYTDRFGCGLDTYSEYSLPPLHFRFRK